MAEPLEEELPLRVTVVPWLREALPEERETVRAPLETEAEERAVCVAEVDRRVAEVIPPERVVPVTLPALDAVVRPTGEEVVVLRTWREEEPIPVTRALPPAVEMRVPKCLEFTRLPWRTLGPPVKPYRP